MTFIMNVMRRPALLLRDFTNIYAYCAAKSPRFEKCSYSEWVHRRPTGIVNENYVEEERGKNARANAMSRRRRKGSTDLRSVKQEHPAKQYDKTGKHEILEASEKLINQIMLQTKSRQRREKADSIVMEGFNFIKDGIDAGVKLKMLLFSNQSSWMLDGLTLPNDVKLYRVPYKVVQTWSTLATPPGILGVFEAPDLSLTEPASDALPLTVICDSIGDPKNLGSIIRAVAAVGGKKLILIKGCVDVWNPATLRAAAGAQFRLPIENYPTWKQVGDLVDPDANVYIADNRTFTLFNKPNTTEKLEEKREAESDESSSDSEEEKEDEKSSTEGDEEHRAKSGKKTVAEKMEKRKSGTQLKREFRKFLSDLPIQVFYMTDYTRNENVLVVGGESQGFSPNIKSFLQHRKVERLHIPLSNNIDSLNSGMAVGIVVYEIRRQFLTKQLKA